MVPAVTIKLKVLLSCLRSTLHMDLLVQIGVYTEMHQLKISSYGLLYRPSALAWDSILHLLIDCSCDVQPWPHKSDRLSLGLC